jgi:multiple sugar transport system substrate-binding protein
MKISRLSVLAILVLLFSSFSAVSAQDWDLAAAAEPYRGVTINAAFLDRPGYEAAIAMTPQFEEITGIDVTWEQNPYENTREIQVLDFTSDQAVYDVVLVDVVWIGEFAANGWVVPMSTFIDDAAISDPNLNLEGFFPILLESFGSWDGAVYGLPFDNYSGLMYYNSCMLEEAGFDAPPATWQEMFEVYGPALTNADAGQYAYALQSRRGETQSADSFMRMVWAGGGSLLNDEFQPNLSSAESLQGLTFRQDMMQFMPPDVVSWDHDETVQALAQGNVAIITEWSGFYATLANPETSTISDCLGIAVEPAGFNDAGPQPALGGFSLGVNADSTPEEQAAAWLYIQWVTGEAQSRDFIVNGGVSARMGVYEDAELAAQYPYFGPLVESWQNYGNAVFRPRFPEWPEISEIIAQTGSEMMLGSVSVEDGVASIEAELQRILAPYYDGTKPPLQ